MSQTVWTFTDSSCGDEPCALSPGGAVLAALRHPTNPLPSDEASARLRQPQEWGEPGNTQNQII